MARIISSYKDWETLLAPRLILGLWHPVFIRPALTHLPRLRRYHIGISPKLARQYFWDACEGFSMRFAMLVGYEGQNFIRDCREAGKEVCVWTVNDPSEMKTAMSWGVKAVLTDKVAEFVKLREEVSNYFLFSHRYRAKLQAIADPASLSLPGLAGWVFPWSDWKYYTTTHVCADLLASAYLRSQAPLASHTSTLPNNSEHVLNSVAPTAVVGAYPT